jgi:hypothetical protein
MSDVGSGTRLFPLPAIDMPKRPSSCSRRLVQRYATSAHITSLANHTISALNTLHQSFSHSNVVSSVVSRQSVVSASSVVPPSTRHVSPNTSQSRLLAHVYRCASRFRRGGLSTCDGDSDFIDHSSFAYSSLRSSAIPIVAAQVSLPSSVGSVDLTDLLPPHLASEYLCPVAMLRPPMEVPKTPRILKFASSSEYCELVRRMHSINMLAFTTDPKVVNGFFGVPKDGDKIRLIIDARPANCHFTVPPKVELPTPDLLANLVAPAGKPFYVAKVDLDNFYHRLRLPVWMRPYFALPPVRAGDIGLSELHGADTLIYPCCTTLPMGWSHSVYVAQLAHEHLLNTCTQLRQVDRITATSDLKLDRTRHSVYIDDLILLGHDATDLSRLQHQYINVVQSKGLVVKMSKLVAPTCDGAECVGLEVHGVRHEVGLRIDKLVSLCSDTVSLLRAGRCSGFHLSRLVGKWTWAALVNRPLLSVFSSVYRFIECARGSVFTVWPSVARELTLMVGLAPLMFCTLTDEWFDRMVATDASEVGLGVVATRLESDRASDILNHHDLQQHSWSTIVSSTWRRQEHINVLEVRALTTAIKWILSFPSSVRRRVIIFMDSLVSIFSVSKGRSSSHLLLPRLRQVASLLLASGVRLYLRWVPSEHNPADQPSRACLAGF